MNNRPEVAIIATTRMRPGPVSQASFNTWASSVLDLGFLLSGVCQEVLLRVAATNARRAPLAYLMPMANFGRDELPAPRPQVILETHREKLTADAHRLCLASVMPMEDCRDDELPALFLVPPRLFKAFELLRDVDCTRAFSFLLLVVWPGFQASEPQCEALLDPAIVDMGPLGFFFLVWFSDPEPRCQALLGLNPVDVSLGLLSCLVCFDAFWWEFD